MLFIQWNNFFNISCFNMLFKITHMLCLAGVYSPESSSFVKYLSHLHTPKPYNCLKSLKNQGKSGKKSFPFISRPGQSKGLLFNHLHHWLIHYSHWLILCENIFTGPPRPNDWRSCFHLWNRLCWKILENSKSLRASKSHHWFKSFGEFAEIGDFAYWWSCIRKGLRLKPAQEACFIIVPNLFWNSQKLLWW